MNNGGKSSINSVQSDDEYTVTIREIMENYEENKLTITKYIKFKQDACNVNLSPTESFLNENVMPILRDGLCRMLLKVKEDDSFYKPKSTLNGLDFLSEYLYNMNPSHPDRKLNWTYIFDAQWVVDFLDKSPRPYYPLSLIWSNDTAARKVQAFWRGYSDRKKDEIQEVRKFWKNVDNEMEHFVG